MAHLKLALLLVVASALCVNSQSATTTTPSADRPTTPYEPSVLGTKYGYYEVRDGAHMFYWYFEKAPKASPEPDAPLIVWLSTASSTGYGNFEEIGTHYEDGVRREDTWTKYFNVLFVDSPVGLGFSYTEKDSLLTTNNSQAADDLLEFIRRFCADNTRLTAGAPIYIVGESFAAKAALEFVIKLNEKIQASEPQFELIKLAGVVLASPFISPAHSLSSMTEYLKSLAIIDIETSNRLNTVVTDITAQSKNATNRDDLERLSEMLKDIATVTRNVNLFNVLTYDMRCETCNSVSQYEIPFFLHPVITKGLFQLMNTKVKQNFRGVVPNSVVWNSQVNRAFKKLRKDVLSSSMTYSQVAELADSGVKVVIVNGQYDGVTPALGTMNWMEGAQNETDSKGFSNRRPFICNHNHLGYVAEFGNMNVYTILGAGHYITDMKSTALLKLILKETGLKYRDDSHDHHPTTPSYSTTPDHYH